MSAAAWRHSVSPLTSSQSQVQTYLAILKVYPLNYKLYKLTRSIKHKKISRRKGFSTEPYADLYKPCGHSSAWSRRYTCSRSPSSCRRTCARTGCDVRRRTRSRLQAWRHTLWLIQNRYADICSTSFKARRWRHHPQPGKCSTYVTTRATKSVVRVLYARHPYVQHSARHRHWCRHSRWHRHKRTAWRRIETSHGLSVYSEYTAASGQNPRS